MLFCLFIFFAFRFQIDCVQPLAPSDADHLLNGAYTVNTLLAHPIAHAARPTSYSYTHLTTHIERTPVVHPHTHLPPRSSTRLHTFRHLWDGARDPASIVLTMYCDGQRTKTTLW